MKGLCKRFFWNNAYCLWGPAYGYAENAQLFAKKFLMEKKEFAIVESGFR